MVEDAGALVARVEARERDIALLKQQLARLLADLAEREAAERAMGEGPGPL